MVHNWIIILTKTISTLNVYRVSHCNPNIWISMPCNLLIWSLVLFEKLICTDGQICLSPRLHFQGFNFIYIRAWHLGNSQLLLSLRLIDGMPIKHSHMSTLHQCQLSEELSQFQLPLHTDLKVRVRQGCNMLIDMGL